MPCSTPDTLTALCNKWGQSWKSNHLIYYQLLDFCLVVVRYIDTVRADSESSIVPVINTSQLEAKLAQAEAQDIWHHQKGSSLIRSSNLLYYLWVGCWLAWDRSLSVFCNAHENRTLTNVNHSYASDLNMCLKWQKASKYKLNKKTQWHLKNM